MPKQLFSNDVQTNLVTPALAADLTIDLVVADAAKFTVPSNGDWEMLVIKEDTKIEVVKCTDNTNGAMTVVRAQEGTNPQDFTVAATVFGGITKGTLEILQSAIAANTASAVAGGYGVVSTTEVVLNGSNITVVWEIDVDGPLLVYATGTTDVYIEIDVSLGNIIPVSTIATGTSFQNRLMIFVGDNSAANINVHFQLGSNIIFELGATVRYIDNHTADYVVLSGGEADKTINLKDSVLTFDLMCMRDIGAGHAEIAMVKTAQQGNLFA